MTKRSARFQVLLTAGAERNLESIYHYVATFDRVVSANRLLDQLMATAAPLAQFSERGSLPRELIALGIKEYRQTLFKPYP